MRIVIVEDDHIEACELKEFFEKKVGAKVVLIATESEFVDRLDQIAAMQPSIVIMDVMLRWADPTPDLDERAIPADVVEEGFYTAGIRCMKRLQSRAETRKIPVILYSALDQSDLEYEVHTKDVNYEKLYDEVTKRLIEG